MPVTVDAIKTLSIETVRAAKGNDAALAYELLCFGRSGVPGLSDAAELVAKANSQAANDLTAELALELVKDASQAGIAKTIESAFGSALQAAGVTAAGLTSAAFFVVAGLLEPTSIGDEPGSGTTPMPPTAGPPEPPANPPAQPAPPPTPSRPSGVEPPRQPNPDNSQPRGGQSHGGRDHFPEHEMRDIPSHDGGHDYHGEIHGGKP